MSTGEASPESPTLSVDSLLRNPKALEGQGKPSHHDESLFSANSQFGRVTGQRLRRKGDKKQIVDKVEKNKKRGKGLQNSHGGPVGAKMEENKSDSECADKIGSHPQDLAILNTEFGACRDQVLWFFLNVSSRISFFQRLTDVV